MFPRWRTTIRGSDHVRDGRPCQDSSGTLDGGWFVVAAVADGHGGERYIRSDVGSRLAVEAALGVVGESMADREAFLESYREDPDDVIDRVKAAVISRWYDAVSAYDASVPLDDKEKEKLEDLRTRGVKMRRAPVGQRYEGVEFQRYGTTLVVAVLSDDLAYGIQVGDGDMVVMKDSNLRMPMPEDPRCVQPYTSSMCDEDAFGSMRHWHTPVGKTVDAAVVSTDGAIKSFSDEGSYMRFSCAAVSALSEGGTDRVEKALEERARAGGDDTSVAAVWREGYMPRVPRASKARPDLSRRHGTQISRRVRRRRAFATATRHGRQGMRRRSAYVTRLQPSGAKTAPRTPCTATVRSSETD